MPDISAIKRALRDQCRCRTIGSDKNSPVLVEVADGVYHLVIAGVLYRAGITSGKISVERVKRETFSLAS